MEESRTPDFHASGERVVRCTILLSVIIEGVPEQVGSDPIGRQKPPGIFLREDKDLPAALSDALFLAHVTMQLFPGVSDRGRLEPPPLLSERVARLRRAPR